MEATLSRHIPKTAAPAAAANDPLKTLRLLVYLYIALWLFEGALRKWIVPGLSGPLLIIRDPVVIVIYLMAINRKLLRFEGFTAFIFLLAILSSVISLGLPFAPPLQVIAFGFRANFLHLPLLFLLPRIFDYRHVRMVGLAFLWIAVPMALLAALQYISPAFSRFNAGAGGSENGMLETARGHIRPSGTFSFTNGLAGFCGLIGAYLLHHLLERKVFPRLVLFSAAAALLVLVVVSGSRTTLGLIVILLMAVGLIWILQPRYMRSSLKFFAIGFVVVTVIGSFSILREGVSTLAERFGDKKNVHEGFVMRFVNEFTKPIDTIARAEPFGAGIGMGTNAASSMMYGKVRFNLGESDYDRVIMEMGPFLGLSYIAWRILAAIVLVRQALLALKRDSNTLPLLLATACLPDLLQGQFGQTTTLGFAMLTAGLALAATQRNPDGPAPEFIPDLADTPPAPIPGRSRYAADLITTPAPAPPITSGKPMRGRSAYSELTQFTQPEPPPAKRRPSKAAAPAKKRAPRKKPTPS